MNQDPLTDPTSLIAYRLANGESSRSTRPSRRPAGAPAAGVFAAGAIGLAVVTIVALACIF